MNTKQNWKAVFFQTDLSGIVSRFHNADIALCTAINRKHEIIHPGALLVFRSILNEILERTKCLGEECEQADLEAFTEEKKIEEEAG